MSVHLKLVKLNMSPQMICEAIKFAGRKTKTEQNLLATAIDQASQMKNDLVDGKATF